MGKIIVDLLSKVGIGITSFSNLTQLRKERSEVYQLRNKVKFINTVKGFEFSVTQIAKAINEVESSTAQLQQDLLVLMLSNFKYGGYFVEFGATDGIKLSNTYLLEKKYNWKGILAEPGICWHESLKNNRRAIIETKCVWESSGELLKFNETKFGELSTIDSYSYLDMHAEQRQSGKVYDVPTISLTEMLEKNNAPEFIDYLSIDTEGSEYEILRNFNFDKFRFGFISCEHNYGRNRELIFMLLSKNGYVQILNESSDFDDWYIHGSINNLEKLV